MAAWMYDGAEYKASGICDEINSMSLQHSELSKEVLSYGDTILDETGSLAIKTREGLKNISECIDNLLQERNKLVSDIKNEAERLQDNYDEWYAEQKAKKNENSEDDSNDSSS